MTRRIPRCKRDLARRPPPGRRCRGRGSRARPSRAPRSSRRAPDPPHPRARRRDECLVLGARGRRRPPRAPEDGERARDHRADWARAGRPRDACRRGVQLPEAAAPPSRGGRARSHPRSDGPPLERALLREPAAAASGPPFMDAAIDDALGLAAGRRPAGAPCRSVAPRDVGGRCRARARDDRDRASSRCARTQPVASAKTIDAVDVTPDDLDAMRDFLREIAAEGPERRDEGGDAGVQPAHRRHRQQAPRSHRGLPADGGARGQAPRGAARPTTRRSRRRSRRSARS